MVKGKVQVEVKDLVDIKSDLGILKDRIRSIDDKVVIISEADKAQDERIERSLMATIKIGERLDNHLANHKSSGLRAFLNVLGL